MPKRDGNPAKTQTEPLEVASDVASQLYAVLREATHARNREDRERHIATARLMIQNIYRMLTPERR